MATIEDNIAQAISDFDDIEAAIEESGVEVPYDTDTSNYGNLVRQAVNAGKQAEYDAFWDTYQNYGKPMDYRYAFYNPKWNDTNFKPKYNIVYNSAETVYLFLQSNITEVNVDIDTSRCATFHYLIYYAQQMRKVKKIILKDDGSQTAFGPFINAPKLEYIRFEGKIGCNVSFQHSPLDVDSAKNVIEHLMDYSGTSNDLKYTITFSETTKTLIAEEGATSPNGNDWLTYAQDKGWNV